MCSLKPRGAAGRRPARRREPQSFIWPPTVGSPSPKVNIQACPRTTPLAAPVRLAPLQLAPLQLAPRLGLGLALRVATQEVHTLHNTPSLHRRLRLLRLPRLPRSDLWRCSAACRSPLPRLRARDLNMARRAQRPEVGEAAAAASLVHRHQVVRLPEGALLDPRPASPPLPAAALAAIAAACQPCMRLEY
eukprot:scaffold101121_cov63-Phaeocystis_antarctica.AAC.4